MSKLSPFVYNKRKIWITENVCKTKDFCVVVKLSEDTKVLEFNQYQKSDKKPAITYADLVSLIQKLMDVKIILKNHLQQK